MGEAKLKNLDLTENQESLDQTKLSLFSSTSTQHVKPNKVQTWLINVISSGLSYVIVLFFLTLIGLFTGSSDSKKS